MAPFENTGTGNASLTRLIASQLQLATALPFCSFVRPWTVMILIYVNVDVFDAPATVACAMAGGSWSEGEDT